LKFNRHAIYFNLFLGPLLQLCGFKYLVKNLAAVVNTSTDTKTE